MVIRESLASGRVVLKSPKLMVFDLEITNRNLELELVKKIYTEKVVIWISPSVSEMPLWIERVSYFSNYTHPALMSWIYVWVWTTDLQDYGPEWGTVWLFPFTSALHLVLEFCHYQLLHKFSLANHRDASNSCRNRRIGAYTSFSRLTLKVKS